MSDLRYPIGQFSMPAEVTEADRTRWIDDLANVPAALGAAIGGLGVDQVNTPYRPEGWTVRQVVHHVPDSHLHAYARFKLALTEDEPTIKPYDEGRWSQLSDVWLVDPRVSLDLLEALHRRWVALLRSLRAAEYQRTFRHPELGRTLTLDETLARYAWHGRHHTAHVTSLRQRKGWS